MPKASQKVLWSKLIKSRFGLLELVGAQIPLRVHSDVLLQVISSYLRYTDVHPTVSAASTWRGPPAAPPHKQGPEARATNHEDRTDVFAPTRDPDTEQPNKDRPS